MMFRTDVGSVLFLTSARVSRVVRKNGSTVDVDLRSLPCVNRPFRNHNTDSWWVRVRYDVSRPKAVQTSEYLQFIQYELTVLPYCSAVDDECSLRSYIIIVGLVVNMAGGYRYDVASEGILVKRPMLCDESMNDPNLWMILRYVF